MRIVTAAMTAFGLVLSGCGQADAPAKTETETAQDTHIAAAAPTPSAITRAAPPPTGKPVGPAERRTAAAREEIGTAADVSQLQALPDQNAKVFSLSGGDPAVNGLVTYFALFGGSAEGWRAYPLGDYAEWKVVEAKGGRVVLAVRQDTAGPNGDILKVERTVQIDFPPSGETPPDAVSVSTSR
ncbi:hypothetical protein PFY01_08030 [Brevundimonas vesicularis]|uniref:hypothetical protein n=1 Tax=Brevundimonas vesicularis TaxID=41276 RepID=UPI0022EC90D3|nr:hypothetical protein [Brevundimonas vesicularis]WBT04691.1 hypothetical protein PFY01_08030 [Brevundimonas vesicularis]